MRRALPWLALVCALVVATSPAWRLAAGVAPSVEDLVRLRCGPR